MTAEELNSSLVLLQAAGYRVRDLENYKALLMTMFSSLPVNLWSRATQDILENYRGAYVPKPVEWKGYVRAAYDKLPKIGHDSPPVVVPPAEEQFIRKPNAQDVRCWRMLFAGDINFDQDPELVLAEIMTRFRERRLKTTHRGMFGTFFDRLQPTVEAIGIVREPPPKRERPAKRANRLVQELKKAPAPAIEAEHRPVEEKKAAAPAIAHIPKERQAELEKQAEEEGIPF